MYCFATPFVLSQRSSGGQYLPVRGRLSSRSSSFYDGNDSLRSPRTFIGASASFSCTAPSASFSCTSPVRSAVVLDPPKTKELKKSGFGLGGGSDDYKTDSGSGSAKTSRSRNTQYPGKWKVLLHNDAKNTMEYVVESLMAVIPGLTSDMCIQIMLEAHNTGVGLVGIFEKEIAEHYCDCLRTRNLFSSIEPEKAADS